MSLGQHKVQCLEGQTSEGEANRRERHHGRHRTPLAPRNDVYVRDKCLRSNEEQEDEGKVSGKMKENEMNLG